MLLEYNSMTSQEMLRMVQEIYTEGNRENAQWRNPGVEDLTEAIREEEGFFMEFLEEFMADDRNRYYILEVDGQWVSALRLTKLDGFYYLEALETAEAHRKKGYGSKLICEVISALRQHGPVAIRSSVDKENTQSLATHKKCGFVIDQENGINYLNGDRYENGYGMLYTEESEMKK